MGSTAALTPAEGPDSPLYLSSVSESEGRLRSAPPDSCYTYHKHPQYHGFSCSGPAVQYWPVATCRVCSPVGKFIDSPNDHNEFYDVDLPPLADDFRIQSGNKIKDFSVFAGSLHDDIVSCTQFVSDVPSLVPQSGVFPYCGIYDGVELTPEMVYNDGSVILETVALFKTMKANYLLYYENGNFSLPPPPSNWYESAIELGRALRQAKPDKPRVLFTPQSGETTTMMDIDTTREKVITTFEDDTGHYDVAYESERDNTYYTMDSSELSLAAFMSRPVKVFAQMFTPASTANPKTLFIQPSVFFTNKRIVNRFNNYRNMKCDLCFRFLINGTPFHYGRWMAFALSNSTNDAFVTPTTVPNNLIANKIITSQLPSLFINPSTSQGGCLRLPYVHHYNAFDTTSGEHNNTGFIGIIEMSALKQLSTVVDPITLTVMCWAENVVLGAPTQSNVIGLVPQSGDEYGKNVISKSLTVASDITGVLSSVAFFKPYALASKAILNGAASIAIALGFSKPVVVSNIDYMCPRTLPNFSSAVQHDPIYKLTYDDKQEVTYDPSVVGLVKRDEMDLKSICQRESFLTTITWLSSAAPENLLYNFRVTPTLWDTGTGTGPAQPIGMPPMCYVMQLFRQWRGSIRFRFVAIASSFHRGRIRITYDPNGTTAPQVSSGLEYNTNFNYIWDISLNHEAVVDVGYMSHLPYLRPSRPGQAASTTVHAIAPVAHDASFDNGTLSLVVLNDLSANGIAQPTIDILCFVSAGPDFEMYDPTDALDNYTLFPQSGELMQDDLMAPVAIKPHVVFGNYISATDRAPLIHHGDSVLSLRYLLKRYTQYFALTAPSLPSGGTVLDVNLSAFPLHRGKAPNGMHTAGGGSYNYVYQTPLAWFSAMYFARRGGIRVRVRDVSHPDVRTIEMKAVRNSSSAAFVSTATAPPAFTTASAGAKSFITTLQSNGNAGMVSSTTVDGGRQQLDCEIPYHSQRRFFSPRLGDNSSNHNQGMKVQISLVNTATAARAAQYSVIISAADDFSLSGFACCPLVYYVPSLL